MTTAQFGYSIKLTPGIKDVWARDYMPFRCSDGKLVAYRYESDYLQKEDLYLQSHPLSYCCGNET